MLLSMIEAEEPRRWQELEQSAARLLQEANFEVKIRPSIPLARGAAQVDLLVTDRVASPPQVILVECKHWCRRVTQAEVHAFRTVVTDAGANGGLLLSASGFQPGAQAAARHSNVRLVTWQEFQSIFAGRWMEWYARPSLILSFHSLKEMTDIYHLDEDERLCDLSPQAADAFWHWVRRASPLVRLADFLSLPCFPFLPGLPQQPDRLVALPLAEKKENFDLTGVPESLLHIPIARPFLDALLTELDRTKAELDHILPDRRHGSP
jgi:hypothetical protein